MLSVDKGPGLDESSRPPTSTAGPVVASFKQPQPDAHVKEEQHVRHVWVITGPAGCGKTTVANHLATHFNFPYIEGDKYHTPVNIQKMSSGIPLTDADRWDWLIVLRQEALSALSTGTSGVVLTCSALRRRYRDVFRIASYNDPKVRVHFVYLKATEEMLLKRVRERKGHYMKDDMVTSQFQSLEQPEPDEWDVLTVQVGAPVDEVNRLALEAVQRALEEVVAKEHEAAEYGGTGRREGEGKGESDADAQ